MKLIIQIPCLNEADQLPATLAALPVALEGVDVVEWLIIDDGSTDATVEVAKRCGVHHVVKLPQNRGLATAFQAGLDACLKLGADVVVNTDADNQYNADDIQLLTDPVVAGLADIVVGTRDLRNHEEFSALKIRLQLIGSWVVRKASGTSIPDATSGFRAYSREAAIGLTVVNSYTYTIESLIQAGRQNAAITSVPIRTNAKVRDSRLFGSMFSYIKKSALTIGRVFAAYEPLKFFGALSALLLFGALLSSMPFVVDWLRTGDTSGHLQSIILAAALGIASVQLLALAVVADLIASQRVVSQRTLERVRRLELQAQIEPSHYEMVEFDPAVHADRRSG
ncbi:MAG: glycosyltransferase family 2 protein [Acidimicrobiales bacterium]|nr:glycosyltransferase family 2 protein [Acidimicrobiales bacterium]